MDSLIGLIVLLAIVFGFVEKFSKKAKANRSKSEADALTRPDRPMPFKARPQVNAPTAAHSDAEKIRQALKSLQDPVAPKEGASVKITRVPRQKKAATVLPQGASEVDAHGCIGGSLGEHRAEGEAQRASTESNLRPALTRNAESIAAQPRVTVRDLRKAVVMSEILDRPKALRPARRL